MKEAVNFLRYIYQDSVSDIANILVAEANDDKEAIEKYLMRVHNYTEKLINRLKEDEK